MADFIFSINAVLPIFLVMLLGFLLRLRNFVDEAFVQGSTKVMFSVALPCMLFRNIMEGGISQSFDLTLAAIGVFGTLAITALLWIIVPRFIKDPAVYTAYIQSCVRSNYALLGIPLVQNIAGPAAIGKASALLSIMVPFYNVLAVLILAQSDRGTAHHKPRELVKRIVTNPLIIACVVAISFSLLGLRLPVLIDRPLGYLADMATPLALFTLGSSINLKTDLSRVKPALAISAIRLLVFPLIFLSIGVTLGLRNGDLAILLALASGPAAISCFPMAYQMGADYHLTSMSILISTFLSALTILLLVYLTRVLGLIV